MRRRPTSAPACSTPPKRSSARRRGADRRDRVLERFTGLVWLAPWLPPRRAPRARRRSCWRRGAATRRSASAPGCSSTRTAARPRRPCRRRGACGCAWLPRALEALALLPSSSRSRARRAGSELPSTTEGIDILLCLDTSSSMAADRPRPGAHAPRRRARRRRRVRRGRPDDRIGLVTFARYPDVRCPLTLDHAALAALLADVRTVASDGPEDATGDRRRGRTRGPGARPSARGVEGRRSC